MTRISIDRKELVSKLENGTIEVTFEKVDGSVRKMRATLNEQIIPQTILDAVKHTRIDPVDVLSVFDVEVGNWRSFRLDSVLQIN